MLKVLFVASEDTAPETYEKLENYATLFLQPHRFVKLVAGFDTAFGIALQEQPNVILMLAPEDENSRMAKLMNLLFADSRIRRTYIEAFTLSELEALVVPQRTQVERMECEEDLQIIVSAEEGTATPRKYPDVSEAGKPILPKSLNKEILH